MTNKLRISFDIGIIYMQVVNVYYKYEKEFGKSNNEETKRILKSLKQEVEPFLDIFESLVDRIEELEIK